MEITNGLLTRIQVKAQRNPLSEALTQMLKGQNCALFSNRLVASSPGVRVTTATCQQRRDQTLRGKCHGKLCKAMYELEFESRRKVNKTRPVSICTSVDESETWGSYTERQISNPLPAGNRCQRLIIRRYWRSNFWHCQRY